MLMDTTREIEELQNKLWMKKSIQERAKAMFGMFATARRAIIESLPKNISEKEFIKLLYFRTYGENLPDDFFKESDQSIKS